jgi:hypothetical protein
MFVVANNGNISDSLIDRHNLDRSRLDYILLLLFAQRDSGAQDRPGPELDFRSAGQGFALIFTH